MKHQEALNAYKNKDFQKAFNIWKEESKKQNHQAMANITLMYLKAEGVSKDYLQAKYWFEKSSSYGNASANFNLALMYQTKIGVEEDIQKAKDYFRKAVQKNHTQASFRLALILLQNRKSIDDLKEGFECMIKAANNGHTLARIQLYQNEKQQKENIILNTNFRKLNKEKQLKIVKDSLDRYIKPILLKDGGNILLVEYINNPDIELRLAYQGACIGCSIASTGTYFMIENTIKKIIDEKVKILIL
ncbi:hypothetical protein CRV00_04310 [Malaciobacter molluscorum]|uniref:NifU family protein n=1 Tax=Malaciobacter molluscorum TaxID=1032072 RepID=UPI00100B2298|nr:NifU family protein [Malaciobacter molluscorum]RXJ95672.1 hypothetical protein CRV00_04310 [Malaciobacter molluscorum]